MGGSCKNNDGYGDRLMSKDLIFCNATIRPNCLLSTNLCCLVCQQIEDCRTQCGKVKPCEPDEDLDDDGCEYLI